MEHTTDRFLRIEAIFHKALAAPDDTREGLIETQCQDDRELASEVRSLLEACKEEEELTATRHVGVGAGQEAQSGGKRVGPYEIDRLVGRGGMGAVYLAHRADGHFEQKVAIKLIDLPLATDLFRERFRQERQILAELQHPYIARLLDGGVTAEGDLFLVMEYVDGVPIHNFCDQRHLSIRQRIALFMRVCEAVQFAHQHFVVHRQPEQDAEQQDRERWLQRPGVMDEEVRVLKNPDERAERARDRDEVHQSQQPGASGDCYVTSLRGGSRPNSHSTPAMFVSRWHGQ